MKQIDISKSGREEHFKQFKAFSNSTYSCNVEMDITKLLNYSKANNQSSFINLLYIILKAMNETEEMKMRLVDDKPVLFERVNSAFAVMSNYGKYKNARQKYYDDYKRFYNECKEVIEEAKKITPETKVVESAEGIVDDIYFTCLPWIAYTQMTHPIPDNHSSQCIPRVCWGKYFERDGKTFTNLNITVSHIFVDGYPLSQTFIKIQNMLETIENYLI